MRAVIVLGLVCILAAGCGGGKKTTFTNENWGELEYNAQQGKYDGSPVDFVGQVYLVDTEADATWFAVYADATRLNYGTLVELKDSSFRVAENDLVHVVGKVDQTAPIPDMVMWDTGPVVVAKKATVVPPSSG